MNQCSSGRITGRPCVQKFVSRLSWTAESTAFELTMDEQPYQDPDQLPGFSPKMNRRQSRSFAVGLLGLLEGSLALLAMGIGYLFGFSPLHQLHWSWQSLGIGLVCVVPMVALFWFSVLSNWRPLRRIRMFLLRRVMPLFDGQPWIAVLLISVLAGVGEEVFFRGLVQNGLENWIGGSLGLCVGLFVGSTLFGMLHSASRTYMISAAIFGFYFGLLLLWTDNLLVPIVAHAVYDCIALYYYLILRQMYLKRSVSS